METKNQGLADIERRRAIVALLKIPPALLGLSSLDDLQKILQGEDIHHSTTSAAIKQHTVDTAEIQLYQEALGVFRDKYEQGNLRPQAIEAWIDRINNTIEHVHDKKKNDGLIELAKYHILAASPYYHDIQNWVQATRHLNAAKEIAGMLNDNTLFTTASYYTGEMYLVQGKPLLACKELESAISLSKTQVKGNILANLALACSMTSASETNTLYIRKLLDEAEKHASNKTDNTFIRFDTVQYLECKADTLISLKRFNLALDSIDEAEEYIDTRPNIVRNTEYLKILRAECYIKQRKPEYEEALKLLSLILIRTPYIGYYVDYVARLHKLIVASSYGNAPAVADLEMALRSLRGAKQ